MDSYVPKPLAQMLAAVGLLYISAKVFSYVRLLASLFLIPGVPLSKFGPKGSWAVITGASDGIGKEFALQLAKKGYNILLVSRTASKLETLASDISTASPSTQTKILAMDFAQNKDSDFQALERLISGLDVSILVNNVGLSHSIPVPFLQTSPQEMKDIITINVTGTLKVTQMIAPGMAQRKRGLILTMASFGGVFPTPLLATYSGSKAFLQHWGTSLGAELAPQGVTVQVIQSHLVASAMSKIRRTSAMVPSPKQFVRKTLSSIGRSGGSQDIAYTSTPWWSHAIMQWVITNLAPGGKMGSFVLGKNRVMHEDIRRRALRKAERDAKKQ